MGQPPKTNWDSYYCTPYRLSGLTRYFTNRLLTGSIRRCLSTQQTIKIVELGGGGSAFYAGLRDKFNPRHYVVVDNNQAGLDKLAEVAAKDERLLLINHDITKPAPTNAIRGEVVFSVGLIEHFPAELTHRAIAAHFDWAVPNGLVIITYPTPTWLYRSSRWISERMGWWIFHDETPLKMSTVASLIGNQGKIVQHYINWFTPFSQAIIVVRASSDSPNHI
ncbi:class I SAM-dependent methyltransferase [Patescibacteria group bacterium]|nr:class I SAM-dependent methyltransferase [Patescibacteria group bacterium]